MSKTIELAKKLKALADKGIGGEKINAEKMLTDLLKKHNLTIEEIEGEKEQDYFFIVSKEDFKLWYQIVKKVNNDIKVFGPFPIKMQKEMYLKGNYMVSCSVSNYIEIEAKNDFYQRLFKDELDLFSSAFIHANDLEVDLSGKEAPELSREEYNQLIRVRDMADKIKKGTFLKQLQ
ncbi:hypothetical protein [Flavobacterium caseinilyticum]|uniref:DUF2786 domain-containing protein n=1 Tax=Flavobacterium caseinilyticum TaxID=2541732 RepID=A0A4R5AUU7_9FLAO|nr:hypothetical protein [Flavobacterium caseinilyticum]TDD77128.1 hypothetical protein E0F89_05885 [Flavobacterium caseinilyticum]